VIDLIVVIRGLESCRGLRIRHFNFAFDRWIVEMACPLCLRHKFFLLGFMTTYSLSGWICWGNEFASKTVIHFSAPSIVVKVQLSVIFLKKKKKKKTKNNQKKN
jgi:hypothetical protein